MTNYDILKELAMSQNLTVEIKIKDLFELLCDNEKLRKRVEELEERASECEGYYDDEEDEQEIIDRIKEETRDLDT